MPVGARASELLSATQGGVDPGLHRAGIFGDTAPATLHELRAAYGQRTLEELIDRYRLARRPVRDLLVDYLRERQPALDYTSLESLAFYLGKRFWADLEA